MNAMPSLRPSVNARLEQNPLGRSVSMDRPREWRHPWFTTALWLPKKKAWAAFVLAGFVNGRSPVVTTTAGDLRDARGTFFGQLVDARSGAAEIEQLARLAIGGADDSGLADGERVDVPLYQNPPVALHGWRSIGWDGEGLVPQFFRDRGVASTPPGAAAQLERGGSVAVDTLTPPKGNRLLRALDIILHQPRTALTSQISVLPGGVATGVSNVNQTLAVREAASNDRLRLVIGNFKETDQLRLNFSAGTSLLASDYEETTWDEIPVSTVYLLSPPNLEPGSDPDATWQPFVAHSLFWNLSWAQPRLDPVFTTDIFLGLRSLVGVLGGGAGSLAVNYITASINDAVQSALNILTAKSLAGSFWTPTGGGSTSAVPVTAPEPAKPGLDKSAALKAKARAAAQAKRNQRLDPPFPFEGRKFNTSLLNA